MIRMCQSVLFTVLSVFSLSLFADRQYRPVASLERHQLSFGVFTYPFKLNQLVNSHPSYFLEHQVYLPEIHKLLKYKYKDYGQVSLVGGVHLLNLKNNSFTDMCPHKNRKQPLFVHAGLQLRRTFFEVLSSAFGYGWQVPLCSSELSWTRIQSLRLQSSPAQFRQYVSVGLDLSLKIFDKASLYNLDGDYGLNDIESQIKCSLLFKNKSLESAWLCQMGLSLFF